MLCPIFFFFEQFPHFHKSSSTVFPFYHVFNLVDYWGNVLAAGFAYVIFAESTPLPKYYTYC